MGKIWLIVILIVIPVLNGNAQDPNLDKLEMWHDQGHYRLVLRKSKQLIKLDEYADHGLPHMWKALSIAGLGLKKSRNCLRVLLVHIKIFCKKKMSPTIEKRTTTK